MTDRLFSRVVMGIIGVLLVALACALVWSVLDSRQAQRRTVVEIQQAQQRFCEKLNESNARQLALWTPLLQAPRAPLPPNATAAERKAYDDATRARDDFARHLHDTFDPIKCLPQGEGP